MGNNSQDPELEEPVTENIIAWADVPVSDLDLYVGGSLGSAAPTVCLSSSGDFEAILAHVREAGGEVLQEPQDMGPMVGTIAFIRDTEGNRIGIHEPPAEM